MDRSLPDFGARIGIVTAAALAALITLAPRPVAAQALRTDEDPPLLDCLTDVRGGLSASPATIHPREATTLSWSIQVPAGCGALSFSIDGLGAGRTGSRAVSPIASRSYALRASFGGAWRTIATTSVAIELVRNAAGQPTVTILANHETPLLIQALRTPDARVFVRNDLELDLTGYHDVAIARGVQLIGGRTSREPGPLLFVRCTKEVPGICAESPTVLFLIAPAETPQVNVRITGIRLSGGELDAAGQAAPKSFGILVESALGVDIDNNELFGWRGAAVRVQDVLGNICHEKDPGCGTPTARGVRVHRNYIHHNQHIGTLGYGVSVSAGAYALVERNVFNHNRHALMANGFPGTGYLAYRNLVLANGGLHQDVGPLAVRTHQFDVHGTASCDEFLWIDGHLNCGDAGEYFDVRFNSFFYTADNAFKLRGKPSVGVDIVSNAFAHPFLVGYQPALGGFVEHITAADNLVDVNEWGRFGRCDFDRDGVDDLFLATGQTWWFNSGGAHHWIYLNTSRARLSEISLGDVDGDGRCDVVANGVVSSGGTGRGTTRIADLVWKATTGTLANWEMTGGTVVTTTAPGTVPATWQLAGVADLRGDGRDDLVWRDSDGQLTLWEMAGGRKVAETRAQAPGYTYQGSGDFDADGAGDLLWRDAVGRLVIWFKGRQPQVVAAAVPPDWDVRGVGDFDGDGRADILWRHPSDALWIWHMAGAQWIGERRLTGPAAAIGGVADFDADGRDDILWQEPWGGLTVWFAADPAGALAVRPGATVVAVGDPTWTLAGARDFNRDGRADLLWQEETGRLVVWILAGGQFVREEYPRLPLRTWTLANRLAAVEEGGGGDDAPPPPDDELPVDCFRRCL